MECHQTIAKARHLNEISSGECLIERIKRHWGVAWASTDLEVGEINIFFAKNREGRNSEEEQPVKSSSGSQSTVQGPAATASPITC